MRVLHTSDWHLGKKLYKKDRMPEHELFLSWLTKTVKDEAIEVLVIAGDVFDTPIPTTESLTVFFKFLKSLEDLREHSLKRVYVLAGNHDSARLLESPRPFLDSDFIKVIGTLNPPQSLEAQDLKDWRTRYKDTLEDGGVSHNFCILPFFRTREILAMPWVESLKEENPEISQEDLILKSLECWKDKLLGENAEEENNVLISHHVFGSFMASGSEQGVALSGIDSLPLSLFQDFNLLLLGHIHKKQILRNEPPALYCGSPIPLRFSESNKKSVFICVSKKQDWDIQDIEIPIFRPLIRLETTYENYREAIKEELAKYQTLENPLKAYLELTIKMESPTSGLLEEIRDYIEDFPLELVNYFTTIEKAEDSGPKMNITTITNKSTEELFDLYLGTFELSDDKKSLLKTSFNELCSLQSEEKGGEAQ